MESKEITPQQERLMSLDALRGLDMLFLVGIAGVFQAIGSDLYIHRIRKHSDLL